MTYQLIRIDPINPTFELKFIDHVEVKGKTEVQMYNEKEMMLAMSDTRVIDTKMSKMSRSRLLINDRGHKSGESKTIDTVIGRVSKYKKRVCVKFRIFSGSYKPFWLEYVRDGVDVIETNLIPDTNS